jgi:hypothetical protein
MLSDRHADLCHEVRRKPAISAACVTGLMIVDTPVYWLRFGPAPSWGDPDRRRLMALATLLGLSVPRRLGLRPRLNKAAGARLRGVVGAEMSVLQMAAADCGVYVFGVGVQAPLAALEVGGCFDGGRAGE